MPVLPRDGGSKGTLGANFEVLALSPGLGSKLKAPSGSIAKNNSYNMVGGERASCGEARL